MFGCIFQRFEIAQILNGGDDLLGTGFGKTPQALIASEI